MKVKELIKKLSNMPQHLRVAYSAHDNQENEIADWVESVSLWEKEDYGQGANDDDVWSGYPLECVILRS